MHAGAVLLAILLANKVSLKPYWLKKAQMLNQQQMGIVIEKESQFLME